MLVKLITIYLIFWLAVGVMLHQFLPPESLGSAFGAAGLIFFFTSCGYAILIGSLAGDGHIDLTE